MNHDELELVARATATAAHQLEEHLGEELPDTIHPAKVLASIESDKELEETSREWIEDAEAEVERRRALVADELERRLKKAG